MELGRFHDVSGLSVALTIFVVRLSSGFDAAGLCR